RVSALWTQRGLSQLRALALPPHTLRRRDDSLELLAWITSRVDQLNEQIAGVVDGDSRARLLLTHPGVGPLTALTTVLVLGTDQAFPRQQACRQLRRLGSGNQRLGRQT